MTNPNRLASEWQTYFRRVLPDGVSQIQITETRRAFYCGAAAALRLMMFALEGETEPMDADLQLMDHLSQELQQFGKDLEAGKV